MRAIVLVVLVAACGGITHADPSKCTPACLPGLACCSEPTHSADAGAQSQWRCAQLSGGACPLQP